MSIMAVTSIHRGARESRERINAGSDPCLAVPHRSEQNRAASNLLKEHRPKSCGSFDDANINRLETVVINVSGKRFETYLSTLRRFPNTLLGDPSKLIHFYNHLTGEYFFDRHRKAFNGILYFYQSNGIVERPVGVSESLFTQEALFFGLSQDALQYDESVSSDLHELVQLPTNPYLCKMWVLFEQPNSSVSARVLAIFSVVVIVLSIVVFCVESIPAVNPEKPEGIHMWKTWMIINSICNSWFTLEYLLRLIASPKKLNFIRSYINIIDLVSILPFYITLFLGSKVNSGGSGIAVLKVIRIFRVVRIFKLTRHSRGLHVLASTIKSSSHELSMLVLFLAIGVILFSSAVYYAESGHNEKFTSIPAGFWWAVVTMTTVGYGDLYPKTTLGKFIGTLCAVSGVLVIALPVPVIVSNFEYYYKQEKCRQARENEVIKKLNLDGKFSPIKQTMKMIAQASITLAGGEKEKNEVTYNPGQQLKEKFQTRISFHLRQQPSQTEFQGLSEISDVDVVEETNCNTPMLPSVPVTDVVTKSHPLEACKTSNNGYTLRDHCTAIN